MCIRDRIKTAHYLYNHHEISRELLDRTIDGTIHPKFIRTIRRYYRQLQNSIEIEKTHAYYTPINDGQYFSSPDYFACPNPQIDKNILAETVHKYLYKAMAQLTSTERNLIRKIYVDQIHLRPLATVMGGNRRKMCIRDRIHPLFPDFFEYFILVILLALQDYFLFFQFLHTRQFLITINFPKFSGSSLIQFQFLSLIHI